MEWLLILRLKEVTLAALYRTTREVKWLLESVTKVHDQQTSFESVVLSVRVVCLGCFVTWIHPMIPPDMMMVGGSGVLYHLGSLVVTLDLLNVGHICPVLICSPDVK